MLCSPPVELENWKIFKENGCGRGGFTLPPGTQVVNDEPLRG